MKTIALLILLFTVGIYSKDEIPSEVYTVSEPPILPKNPEAIFSSPTSADPSIIEGEKDATTQPSDETQAQELISPDSQNKEEIQASIPENEESSSTQTDSESSTSPTSIDAEAQSTIPEDEQNLSNDPSVPDIEKEIEKQVLEAAEAEAPTEVVESTSTPEEGDDLDTESPIENEETIPTVNTEEETKGIEDEETVTSDSADISNIPKEVTEPEPVTKTDVVAETTEADEIISLNSADTNNLPDEEIEKNTEPENSKDIEAATTQSTKVEKVTDSDSANIDILPEQKPSGSENNDIKAETDENSQTTGADEITISNSENEGTEPTGPENKGDIEAATETNEVSQPTEAELVIETSSKNAGNLPNQESSASANIDIEATTETVENIQTAEETTTTSSSTTTDNLLAEGTDPSASSTPENIVTGAASETFEVSQTEGTDKITSSDSANEGTEPTESTVSQPAITKVPDDASTASETEINPETTPISSSSVSPEPNQVSIEPETTTNLPEISPTTANPCTEIGNFSNPSNCRRYLSCSGNATNLLSQDIQCPERSAFSPILRRCTRDLSPCVDEEPICLRASSLPNPNGENSSYFWCVPSLLGGFNKYHIQCSANEVFFALFGRCWLETPPQIGFGFNFGYLNRQPSDRDVVKAEWKLLRNELRLKAKQEKVRRKLEKKAKARAEKLAAKELRKQKGVVKSVNDDDDDDDDEDDD